MPLRPIEAVVFDMDGVLLDSEPHWRIAQRSVAAGLGITLDVADLEATMGLRIDACTAGWFARSPWTGPSSDEVADQVVDRVVELVADAPPMPGLEGALEAAGEGRRLGLCSSSPRRLIDAVLDALGLQDRFEVVHSAADEIHGKPHPACYLTAVERLGLEPSVCVAVEDSLNGAIAARAAGMRVIAVPARVPDERFGFADAVLSSLEDLDRRLLADLVAGIRPPSLARPRFHLAFPVDDLAAARSFYGGILGCPEGRSSATWVDFDLLGHQIVAHLAPRRDTASSNAVDGHDVPAEHFGVLLPMADWRRLVARLEGAGVPFLLEPMVRFVGAPGEQATLFVRDPSGNALELKAFRDDARVFSR